MVDKISRIESFSLEKIVDRDQANDGVNVWLHGEHYFKTFVMEYLKQQLSLWEGLAVQFQRAYVSLPPSIYGQNETYFEIQIDNRIHILPNGLTIKLR